MAEEKTITIDYRKQEQEVLPQNNDSNTQDMEFLYKTFFEIYQIKKHVTVAPTYIPKNFFEQFCFFDDGTNRRIYLYINNTWRYVALT